MNLIRNYKGVIIYTASVLFVGVLLGSIPMYFIMDYSPTYDYESNTISKHTKVETPKPVKDYESNNKELNQVDGKLVAAVEAELLVPEIRTVYEVVEVEKNIYHFDWQERGGGSGIVKDREVEMIFNPFIIPVDVEIKRSDDQIYAGVSTTNTEVELESMDFYVDSSELFPEKNISVGVAAGMNENGNAVVHGRAGYKGYDVIYEFDGSHEVMLGKSWSF